MAVVVIVGGYLAVRYSHAATLVTVLPPAKGVYWGSTVQNATTAGFTARESIYGRKMDSWHLFQRFGDTLPTQTMKDGTAAGHIMLMNWKPSDTWVAVANGTDDAYLATQADNIRNWGQPVILAFHHEPENDPAMGTSADYVRAYDHVVSVFRAHNATNVSWAWIMMDYTWHTSSGRDPNAWYPGDNYVDWLLVDVYADRDGWASFASYNSTFYTWATQTKAGSHTKPLGVGEWGTGEKPGDTTAKANYFTGVLAGLKTMPQFKLIEAYDTNGSVVTTSAAAQSAFYTISHDPYTNQPHLTGLFGGTPTPVATTPPPTTPPPTPTTTTTPTKPPSPTVTAAPTTPPPTPTPDTQRPSVPTALAPTLITNNQIALDWRASTDNVAVKGYRLYRNGVLIVDQPNTGYVDQGLAANTSYAYSVAAYDAATNASVQSAPIQVRTQDNPPPPSTDTPTPPGSSNPVTITPPGTSTAVSIPVGAEPVVGGTIGLNTTGSADPCANTTVKVDGTQVSSNGSLDTSYLTNGNHTVTAQGCDQVASRTVTVKNNLTPLESIRNTVFSAFHGNKAVVNDILIGLSVLLIAVVSYFLARWGKKYLPTGAVKSNLR